MTSAAPSWEHVAPILEIQQLKARYAYFADAKYGPGFVRAEPQKLAEAAQGQASCFTDDACWAGGADFGGDIVGREGLVRFFASPPWAFASHYYSSPLIEVEGERATARWQLWQVGVPAEDSEPVFLSARTEETYRRTSEGWLHEYVRFDRIDRIAAPLGMLKIEGIL